MAKNRLKSKGRRDYGRFIALPLHILNSTPYIVLPIHAKQLLIDLFMQFNGKNNGDFCAAWSMMIKRSWRSRQTLHRSLGALISAGFIIKTRQGGRNRASLYGITWLGIDVCKGKLDVRASPVPLNFWKKDNSLSHQ
jgi:hypothetical protein